jgi:hypothetical protein
LNLTWAIGGKSEKGFATRQMRKIKEKLKRLTIALMAAATLGLLLTFLLWNLYSAHLPTFPDPATGRIYRLAQHGLIVYQTKGEHLLYWSVLLCSVVLGCFGGFGIVIYEWISDKR